MKAVEQLIEYLAQEGLLSVDEVQDLTARGFRRERTSDEYQDHPGHYDDDWDDAYPDWSEREWWLRHEELERDLSKSDEKQRRRKGGGRARRRVREQAIEQLCQRLRLAFGEWATVLTPLLRLAESFEPCPDWPAAARILRQIETSRLTEALLSLLESRVLTLPALLAMLTFDEPARVLQEAPQPLAPVCRALLSGSDVMPRIARLLSHPELAVVHNLRVAQSRLAVALRESPTATIRAIHERMCETSTRLPAQGQKLNQVGDRYTVAPEMTTALIQTAAAIGASLLSQPTSHERVHLNLTGDWVLVEIYGHGEKRGHLRIEQRGTVLTGILKAVNRVPNSDLVLHIEQQLSGALDGVFVKLSATETRILCDFDGNYSPDTYLGIVQDINTISGSSSDELGNCGEVGMSRVEFA